LVCSVGLAISLFAPTLLAAPPVLERVPSNAVGCITTSSLSKLQKNLSSFLEAVDAPIPVPAVADLVGQMGIEEGKGFKEDSSAAFVFLAPAGGADAEPDPEKMLVVVLQTTDYKAFVGNFGLTPGAAGTIDSKDIDGTTLFFKDLGGGYMAMAPAKENLERAQWKGEQAFGDAKMVGETGRKLLDSADLAIVINTQEARKFLPQLEKAVNDQMKGNPAGAVVGNLENSPLGAFITGKFAQDTTGTVTGVNFGAQGMGIDVAMHFAEGSDTAKKFEGVSGSTGDLLAQLPAQPYILAMAMDTSSPGARRLIDATFDNLGKEGGGDMLRFVADWAKNSSGSAMTMGMPPGGLMSGLFTSTIAYVRSSDPKAFVKNMQDGLTKLNGKTMEGLALDSTYAEASTEIDGTKVDAWGIKIRMDENAEADPGQLGMALPMIFGQSGGPAGFIAPAKGGLLQTFGRNQALMSSAMKVGKGTDSFTADKSFAKVAEQLPKNRIGEIYIGVKSIVEAAIPLMAMADMQVEVDVPPSLPPIGAGVAGVKDGMHLGVYVPAPTVKVIAQVLMQAQAAQMGGGDEPGPGQDGGKKNDGQKGAGQPRF
jgi:hypothetical protein